MCTDMWVLLASCSCAATHRGRAQERMHRKMTHRAIPLVLALGSSCHVAQASDTDLACTAHDSPHAWVRRIEIHRKEHRVVLSLATEQPADAAPRVQLEAVLEATDDQGKGAGVYAFNAYPKNGQHLTSAFKLYRVGDQWLLLGARLLDVQGKTVLWSAEPSVPFKCS
jgi:hypothetical protein